MCGACLAELECVFWPLGIVCGLGKMAAVREQLLVANKELRVLLGLKYGGGSTPIICRRLRPK